MEDKKLVSKCREGFNKAKIEAASELGTTVGNQYKRKVTSKQSGSIIKRLIEEYERNLIGK